MKKQTVIGSYLASVLIVFAAFYTKDALAFLYGVPLQAIAVCAAVTHLYLTFLAPLLPLAVCTTMLAVYMLQLEAKNAFPLAKETKWFLMLYNALMIFCKTCFLAF